MRLPYKFLLADGQVNDAVARHIENSRNVFPNLDMEYVRYPDDASYRHYFAKTFDALSRVKTPYAMVIDNDDFLGVHGIETVLDFLDVHPDYACGRGQRAVFSLYSGLGNPSNGIYGRFNRFYRTSDAGEISAPTAAERIRKVGLHLSLFYAVYRTEALKTIWREMGEIDFSDLMLHETFYALRAMTLGKVHSNKAAITYFAQAGTSLSHKPLRHWSSELLNGRFTTDAQAVVQRIADGAADPTLAEDVRGIIEKYFREFLLVNYGLDTLVKRKLRTKLPNVAHHLQNRPRFFLGREREALLSHLSNGGASAHDLTQACNELGAIEDSLSFKAFEDYAGPFLSDAFADRRREWY
jgi:glycosyltransferase domain-containing protein